MADTRYLKKRRQGWYFVLKVPADLRSKLNCSSIVRTLKTTDLREAQQLRWKVRAEWEARFEVERGQRQWTPEEIEEQAQREFLDALHTFEEANTDEPGLDITISFEAEKLEDYRLPDLDYALAMARLRAAQCRIAALRSQAVEPPTSFGRRGIDPRTLKPVLAKKRNAGKPFTEAARVYIDELQRDKNAKLTEQTKGQYEAVYRLFDSWAKKPGLDEIDREKASAFLDAIATLDPHWGRSPKTKKRSFAEIVETYGDHKTGLSNRTVNRYATALSQVWQWAARRGWSKTYNPWEQQYRRIGERRKTQKLPFTSDELKSLLSEAPVALPDKQTYPNTLKWVCLIAAYSGMRLNEICDRQVADIKREDGVWYFDVKNAKTEAGDRKIPIHSRLIAAGLLKFKDHHGSDFLFPALKPGGPDSKRSWYLSKRFTEFRRSQSVVRLDPRTGKDRVDFHSFRRSAIQVLQRARLPQTEVAQVVGHEQEGITFKVYNPEGLHLSALREVVEAIKYAGLDYHLEQPASAAE